MEVEKAIGKMKSGKAGGPTELVGEIIRAAGKVGVKKMTEICNMVVEEEQIPKDWELSTFYLYTREMVTQWSVGHIGL